MMQERRPIRRCDPTCQVPKCETAIVTPAEALAHARNAHQDQVDKDGAPYITHIERVVARASELAPPDIRELCTIAAALHDIVEDTPTTFDDLRAVGVPEDAVRAVASLTHTKGEAYTAAIFRAAADPIGRWVKLADHLDNSDESRLALLDDATATRLREKYRSVRPILLEATGYTLPDEPGEPPMA